MTSVKYIHMMAKIHNRLPYLAFASVQSANIQSASVQSYLMKDPFNQACVRVLLHLLIYA